MLYLAFLDESSQSEADQFTTCGLTAISHDCVESVSKVIRKTRCEARLFPSEPLKWTLPEGWDRSTRGEDHRVAKSEILGLLDGKNVAFFGYLHLNHGKEANDAERNAKYGFNTLLSALNRWLMEKSAYAAVVFDRMEWTGAYDFCVEKHTRGLTFPPQWDRADEPLSRLISFSMASARMSDLCSINDISTGALSYIANFDHAINVRTQLVKALAAGMPRDAKGLIREHAFFMRPKDQGGYSEDRVERYEKLRGFLNEATRKA